MRIETTEGLKKLLERYEEEGADIFWLETIKECIEKKIAMDEYYYKHSPKRLKVLWKGLK